MALQHLRSSTANKRPVPGNMSDGQLGINTNTASPGLFFKDSNNTLVKVGPVHVGTTAPNASPAAGGTAGNSVGEQWLDTTGDTYVFKVWDGTAWRSESGTFVDVNGDVMTGALGIIAGSAAAPGLYISGDTNSGLYSPGADQVSVATGGTERLRIDSIGQIEAVSLGTAAAPVFSFTTDTNTGIYSPGADQVSIATGGTERLRVDSTGQIEAVSLGTAAAPVFSFTGDPNTGLYSPGADQLAISTNGTPRLFIDSNGNVLINDSASVTSNVSAYLRIRQVNAATDTSIAIINAQNSDADATVKIKAGQYTRNGGEIVFGRENGADWSTSTSADGYISFSPVLDNVNQERLRITSAGRVGIGTTSPTENLDLRNAGSAAVFQIVSGVASTTSTSTIQLVAFSSASAVAGTARINGTAPAGGQSELSFLTSPTGNAPVERARIDSSGRLLVGTSSAASNVYVKGDLASSTATTPAQQLAVSSANYNGASIISYNANGYAGTLSLASSKNSTIGANTIVANGQAVGVLSFSGNDGTNFIPCAEIKGVVDGTPGQTAGTFTIGQTYRILTTGTTDFTLIGAADSNPGTTFTATGAGTGTGTAINTAGDMPGRLVFSTTADGASSPTERMRIDSAGFVSLGGDTNTGFSNPSADNLAITTGGFERARIDSSGRLLVGTSAQRAIEPYGVSAAGTNGGHVFEQTQTAGQVGIACVNNSDTTASYGSYIYLARTRGSSINANTIVLDGDNLGTISFAGADGTDIRTKAAAIYAEVDGTPGANDMPGRLVFSTTADGAASPTERMRITSDGYVRLSTSSPGIQFGGDTAAANALDDYEEGTFTPTIVGTTTAGTATYGANGQVGRYTKIGNRVFFDLYLAWSAHTGTGDLQINGLPFTVQNTTNLNRTFNAIFSSLTLTAGSIGAAFSSPNTTTIALRQLPTGGGSVATVPMDTSAQISISGSFDV